MEANNVYVFFKSEYNEAIRNVLGKSAIAESLKDNILDKGKISWLEVDSGNINKLYKKQARGKTNNFLVGYFTPIWKNMAGVIRQKVEIAEDEHPVYKEGVVFSSYKEGEDIPLICRGRKDVEQQWGVQRIYFDGTIQNVFEEYGFDIKGKIADEYYKPLVVILDKSGEKTAKKYGYEIHDFFNLDSLLHKRSESILEDCVETEDNS